MNWTPAVQAISYGIAALSALLSMINYWRNARLERLKWISTLYTKFFEQQILKTMREALDCSPDAETVANLIKKEPPELTDYLNFFEFVTYLAKSKHISKDDMRAMFEYFLGCLKQHPCLRIYIKQKGYEHLDAFLEG
jgi:hypothetical protein